MIYADFECFTSNTEHESKYQLHVPSGFCFLTVSTVEKYCKGPVQYTGKNVVECFFNNLIEEEQRIASILAQPIPMEWNNNVADIFLHETVCHICQKHVLLSEKVRDHDHLTGKYRGAAHGVCNLKYRWSKVNPLKKYGFRIPVVFHNLRGYDSHLLMESFGKFKQRNLSCVASNRERFVTFSTGSISFIDSFQFMASSLAKLVNNLAEEGPGKFKNLCKTFGDKHELLLRKGVFPYDFFNCPEKLITTSLPPKEEFYSRLYQEHCSDNDYLHACAIWKVFCCQTFEDYHDLYLKSDVLQLADVFENFRDMSLETYNLDPVHYCTAPGLSWDSMLR